MSTSEKKNSDENKTDLVMFIILFTCAITILFMHTFPNHRRNKELVTIVSKLKSENNILMQNNASLRKQIKALNFDPFYIEAVARSRYRLIKPGEVLIEK